MKKLEGTNSPESKMDLEGEKTHTILLRPSKKA